MNLATAAPIHVGWAEHVNYQARTYQFVIFYSYL